MTWKTGLIYYGAAALLSYVGWLTTLSVIVHLRKLQNNPLPLSEYSFYYGAGGILSMLWPLQLVLFLGAGIVAGGHELVGVVVRKVTRGQRTVNALKKAT